MDIESSAYPLRRATVTPIVTDSEFVSLFHSYENVLYRMAFMYLRNESDALEAVSETVYKAYRDRDSLKASEHFHTWITRVLINTCLNQIKRNKRAQSASEDFLNCNSAYYVTDEVEQRFLIDAAVASLKPEYKTVVLLRFYQDMSIKDTAAVMGKGENTVKTMTRRALGELKRILGKDISYE